MNISKILQNKNLSADEKLESVAEIVTEIRKKYGNTELTISSPEINTVDGFVNLKYVTNETKVKLATDEITRIKIQSLEYSNSKEGVNLKNTVIELIATSPILVNLNDSGNLDYI